MNLVIRAKAQTDLDRIFDYSFAEFGEAIAVRYLSDIGAVLDRLVRYPELGTLQPQLGTDVRTYPTGEHRIIYRIDGSHLTVTRVLHKRMDAKRWN